MTKRALITGVCGQDGAYLAKFLLEQGYEVWGGVGGSGSLSRLTALGVAGEVYMVNLDVRVFEDCRRAVERSAPDEIYNLAARSSVAASFALPEHVAAVCALGATNMLDAVQAVNPEIRFYQASSSEMFAPSDALLNELSPTQPRSPYGEAKLAAHEAVARHRQAYGAYACSGIAFNHESPLRAPEFVSRKITRAAAAAVRDDRQTLLLGNLDAARDWGHAGDYVEAMWRMLQQQEPSDYVLATGVSHTVREFARLAFSLVGFTLCWQDEGPSERGTDSGAELVAVDPALYRPAEVGRSAGDASKARAELGWAPRTSFQDLVAEMVRHDLG